MLKNFGTNMISTSIRFCLLFPVILFSEDLDPLLSEYVLNYHQTEQNITLEQINREITNHLSIDKNSTNYKYQDIVKLRNKLDDYLDNHHVKQIDNSVILINNDVVINNSEVTNDIERVNSNIENSNIGVVIEQNMHNSVIENNVNFENSTISNSNMGIEIRGYSVDDKVKQNINININNNIKSTINDKDSINRNSNNGIKIGH